MPTTNEVARVIDDLGKGIEEFKAEQQRRLDALETKMNRERLGLGGASEHAAGSSPEEVKAFTQWARTGEFERKTMSINVDPAGGYLMPSTLAAQITQVGAEEGAVRRLARVERPSSSDFGLPIAKNLAGATHVGETTTRSETTTPDLAELKPTGGGLAAVAPVTNWALQDSAYDLASFIVESIGMQFGVAEAQDFVAGDGVGKSMGFTSYPVAATADATRPWGTVEKLHAGSVSAISIDNLIDLLGKLAPRYRRNAAWIAHPDTETAVRKLKASTSGDYYWQPSVAAGLPPTLLGIPWYIDPYMPTIASAAPAVALADWRRAYCIADIGVPIMLRDQVTAKGKTLFYSERRVGGGVLDFNSLKLLVMSV